MSAIKSSINTRSEEFKANAKAMAALVDDLREKSALDYLPISIK